MAPVRALALPDLVREICSMGSRRVSTLLVNDFAEKLKLQAHKKSPHKGMPDDECPARVAARFCFHLNRF